MAHDSNNNLPIPAVHPFDFDAWARLAREDPQGFEKARRRVVEDFIANTPAEYRGRLEGIQFQVDMVRRRATNPLDACHHVYALAMRQFHEVFVPAICHGRFPHTNGPAKVLRLPEHQRRKPR